jgi:hypothetical protein
VDEHYHASAERFQEMRWELAADVDPVALAAKREAADEASSDDSPPAQRAEAAATAPPEAVVRLDSETLVAASG